MRIYFASILLLSLALMGCQTNDRQARPNPSIANPNTPIAGNSAAIGNSAAGNTSTGIPTGSGQPSGPGKTLPKIDHVVVVIEENHAAKEVVGNNAEAPYLNALAQNGALFPSARAIEHPSEPNYLDLFSGSNQGVKDDSCPHTFSGPNLASELFNAKLTFSGYSEDLPSIGFTGCSNNRYARKHNPWVNFTNVPPSANLPLSSFPSDFSQLPTVSFVIPNLENDMHDGSIAKADQWLHHQLDLYVQWSKTHNSLLIVTFDEDDNSAENQIATLFMGPMVRPGVYSDPINHFQVLRTLLDLYQLPPLEKSSSFSGVSGIWK